MAKIFYDHLTRYEEFVAELDRYEMAVEEREEIVQLADETIHLRVLDVILTHLPKEKHREFLEKFHGTPHDEKLLEYLSVTAGVDMGTKIKEAAEITKKELLAEVARSKKK